MWERGAVENWEETPSSLSLLEMWWCRWCWWWRWMVISRRHLQYLWRSSLTPVADVAVVNHVYSERNWYCGKWVVAFYNRWISLPARPPKGDVVLIQWIWSVRRRKWFLEIDVFFHGNGLRRMKAKNKNWRWGDFRAYSRKSATSGKVVRRCVEGGRRMEGFTLKDGGESREHKKLRGLYSRRWIG